VVRHYHLILKIAVVKLSLRQVAVSHRVIYEKLKKEGITSLVVPDEFVIEKVISHDVIDVESGEIIANANAVITEELLAALKESTVETIKVLYTNDFDRGSYISDTLRIEQATNELEAKIEIYRMMRPGDPPTEDAAVNLFQKIYFLLLTGMTCHRLVA